MFYFSRILLSFLKLIRCIYLLSYFQILTLVLAERFDATMMLLNSLLAILSFISVSSAILHVCGLRAELSDLLYYSDIYVYDDSEREPGQLKSKILFICLRMFCVYFKFDIIGLVNSKI